jgi:transcriptional regulator with XRE-family HTH domain
MENAERLPRLDTLVKLAGALGVTVADLTADIKWDPGVPRPGSFLVRG